MYSLTGEASTFWTSVSERVCSFAKPPTLNHPQTNLRLKSAMLLLTSKRGTLYFLEVPSISATDILSQLGRTLALPLSVWKVVVLAELSEGSIDPEKSVRIKRY
jgi:hypothetical protein